MTTIASGPSTPDDIFVPELRLNGLGARDLFFQCIYAHPVLTPSITGINKVACEVFERPGNGCGYDAAWMPHLSLVYGDLDVSSKAGAMADLAVDVIGRAFRFGTLQLWRTEGLHTDWRCVKSVGLPLPLHSADALAGARGPAKGGPGPTVGGMEAEEMYNWAAARKAMIKAHDFATKKSSSDALRDDDEEGGGGRPSAPSPRAGGGGARPRGRGRGGASRCPSSLRLPRSATRCTTSSCLPSRLRRRRTAPTRTTRTPSCP